MRRFGWLFVMIALLLASCSSSDSGDTTSEAPDGPIAIEAPDPQFVVDDAGRVLILRRALRPQHVLLCVTNEIVLHADEGAGRVVEHALPSRWRHRLVASYTFVEAA